MFRRLLGTFRPNNVRIYALSVSPEAKVGKIHTYSEARCAGAASQKSGPCLSLQ